MDLGCGSAQARGRCMSHFYGLEPSSRTRIDCITDCWPWLEAVTRFRCLEAVIMSHMMSHRDVWPSPVPAFQDFHTSSLHLHHGQIHRRLPPTQLAAIDLYQNGRRLGGGLEVLRARTTKLQIHDNTKLPWICVSGTDQKYSPCKRIDMD